LDGSELQWPRRKKCGHFLAGGVRLEPRRRLGGYPNMDEINQDKIDRIGRFVSSIAIALLAAMFAYAYLSPIIG
jgi:hypothetical protein